MRIVLFGAAVGLGMGVIGVSGAWAAAQNEPAVNHAGERHHHYHYHYHHHYHSTAPTGHYRHHLHPATQATSH
jgi:hypothetical protein